MGNIIHGVNYDVVKNTVVEQQYTVYPSNSSLRIRFFSVFLTSSFNSVPVEERSLHVSGLADKSPHFRNCARRQKATTSS